MQNSAYSPDATYGVVNDLHVRDRFTLSQKPQTSDRLTGTRNSRPPPPVSRQSPNSICLFASEFARIAVKGLQFV